MSDTNLLDLANSAAETDDQSQTKSGGGGDYTAPEPGLTVGRFIEYVEIGMQAQRPYQGKPKKPREEIKVTFELLAPSRDIHEGDHGPWADKISFRMSKSLSEKSKFKKLFTAMDAGRGKKHMAQFLGEAFLLEVYNYEDSKQITRASLYKKETGFDIRLPVNKDPVTGASSVINVPAALTPLRLFLWNNPTPETWASLFIEGTRTIKDDAGKEVEVSKNWIQELCLKAMNYKGSALEAMLLTLSDMPSAERPVQTGEDTGAADDALNALGLGNSNPALAGMDSLPA